ncbi:hypothetical protein [Paenibacillus sp. Cedars]|uniref:hypothetical protein n=1 Tax=Paenibacillus sp. Cedars TaxID=1980674 RepID=UPI001561E9A7|nr:hypothetical protein [Paenibacillus sp. Cedars]
MSKAIYIAQLPKHEQDEIAAKLKALLVAEGLAEIEVFRAVKDAMDSKVADIMHLFDNN